MNMFVDCPNCLLPYRRDSAHVLNNDGQRRILYVRCSLCEHAMLLSMKKSGASLVCAGMITDCSPEDAKRLLFGEKVSVDDVLMAHEGLQFDKFWEMR